MPFRGRPSLDRSRRQPAWDFIRRLSITLLEDRSFPNLLIRTLAADCKIKVTTKIDFKSEAATKANVDAIIAEIKKYWNGFRYNCCDVVFDIDAKILEKKKRGRTSFPYPALGIPPGSCVAGHGWASGGRTIRMVPRTR